MALNGFWIGFGLALLHKWFPQDVTISNGKVKSTSYRIGRHARGPFIRQHFRNRYQSDYKPTTWSRQTVSQSVVNRPHAKGGRIFTECDHVLRNTKQINHKTRPISLIHSSRPRRVLHRVQLSSVVDCGSLSWWLTLSAINPLNPTEEAYNSRSHFDLATIVVSRRRRLRRPPATYHHFNVHWIRRWWLILHGKIIFPTHRREDCRDVADGLIPPIIGCRERIVLRPFSLCHYCCLFVGNKLRHLMRKEESM